MSYGLVSIDLDRFKSINDRSGHQAGDEVLRRLVATIQQTLRAEDAIYRMGGEEFLVILHVASWEGLLTAAERLRATVAGLGIPLADNTPHGIVTISLGVNLIGPADLVLTDSQWLERSDVALYAAKAAGRNMVVAAARDEGITASQWLERVIRERVAGGLHRGDQRGVVFRIDRVLNDVPARIHGRAADHFGHFGGGGTRYARAGQENRGGERLTIEVHDGLLLRSPAS
jgi:diguanylate cyclase (GGDEF)-like protein